MNEMMTFPDTWEEFEKLYGFNDTEEIYTNNSRLIPSFRVKQWLDHLSSAQQEQLDCEDCIKHGGDWECDRVHCHKGDVPDTNVGELISRRAAIDALDEQITQCDKALGSFDISMKDEYAVKVERASLKAYRETLNVLPSAQPERKRGKWIYYDPNGFKCLRCGRYLEIECGDVKMNFCPHCGSYNGDEQNE